jgi:hypothetical protein
MRRYLNYCRHVQHTYSTYNYQILPSARLPEKAPLVTASEYFAQCLGFACGQGT